jgi:iron(III) transport system substrate-binding protein
MKALKLIAGAAVLALAFAGEAGAQETTQSVYEAAKKEGKVVFWSAMDIVQIKKAGAKFTARYPGVQFEQFQIQPGPALERMVAEANAGRVSADVFDSNLSYLPTMLERNLIETVEWNKVFGIPPIQILYDSKVVQYMNLDIPIAINTSMVKPGDIKSWDDLADPKWRGKVIVEARGLAFAIMAMSKGEDKTFDLLKRLIANKPIITKGGTPTIEALAGGQGAIAVGTYGGRIIQAHEEGAPVG